jgi:nitrogenase iron protein NifH
MSLYAANNIAKGIQRLARRGDTGLAGVICNSASDSESDITMFEHKMLTAFAEILGTSLIGIVPRSPVIRACEVEGRTVLEHSPKSAEAAVFRELAQSILDNPTRIIPDPIEDVAELEALYRRYLPEKDEHNRVPASML